MATEIKKTERQILVEKIIKGKDIENDDYLDFLERLTLDELKKLAESSENDDDDEYYDINS